MCCRLISPRHVAASQTLPISELTVWELIVLLDERNFKHVVKPASRKDPPFDPHDSDKPRVWYSRLGSDTVPRSYLQALAAGTYQVPHWHSAGFYDALLAGVPYKTVLLQASM